MISAAKFVTTASLLYLAKGNAVEKPSTGVVQIDDLSRSSGMIEQSEFLANSPASIDSSVINLIKNADADAYSQFNKQLLAESDVPSESPTMEPSESPTTELSIQPSSAPSVQPSSAPSVQPSSVPSAQPSSVPSAQPSSVPSAQPSSVPSAQPSSVPSAQPSSVPSAQPSSVPSAQPSSVPSAQPSSVPSVQPSSVPSVQPSSVPSVQPSSVPSAVPSVQPSAAPEKTWIEWIEERPMWQKVLAPFVVVASLVAFCVQVFAKRKELSFGTQANSNPPVIVAAATAAVVEGDGPANAV